MPEAARYTLKQNIDYRPTLFFYISLWSKTVNHDYESTCSDAFNLGVDSLLLISHFQSRRENRDEACRNNPIALWTQSYKTDINIFAVLQ